jgi:hypothetical protein
MKHSITSQGNSGLRNAIIHVRKLQAVELAAGDYVIYYLRPVASTWFLGKVIIEDTLPLWCEWYIAMPPNLEPVFIYGADSCQHIQAADYIKWIKALIDNKAINW